MPRISADITDTAIQTAFPDNTIAMAHVSAIEVTTSKVKENDDGTTSGGNPMAIFEWTLDDGPYQGRVVRYDYVTTGGFDKNGKPNSLTKLLERIDGLGVPWAISPDAPLVARPFKRVKTDNGMIVFVDPDNDQVITNIDYEMPEGFLNKVAKVKFGAKKGMNSDRDFNEVKQVLPRY